MALVKALTAAKTDALVLSGDLTAQALPSEFEIARGALKELIAQTPTFVVPGNHDVYTQGSKKNRRIQHYFGDLMGLSDTSSLGLMEHGDYLFVGLDPNRPTMIQASGILPKIQLEELENLLNSDAVQEKNIVLVIHYPILGPKGSPYNNVHHGLLNAQCLIDTLNRSRKRPLMALHGHKHHGYRAELSVGDTLLPTFNPGAGGMVLDDRKKHTGAYNIYTVNGNRVEKIERFIWNGEQFHAEVQGCYSSGW